MCLHVINCSQFVPCPGIAELRLQITASYKTTWLCTCKKMVHLEFTIPSAIFFLKETFTEVTLSPLLPSPKIDSGRIFTSSMCANHSIHFWLFWRFQMNTKIKYWVCACKGLLVAGGHSQSLVWFWEVIFWKMVITQRVILVIISWK